MLISVCCLFADACTCVCGVMAMMHMQAIRDLNGEGLPLMIFANWRGFSGGQRDMFDEVQAVATDKFKCSCHTVWAQLSQGTTVCFKCLSPIASYFNTDDVIAASMRPVAGHIACGALACRFYSTCGATCNNLSIHTIKHGARSAVA